MVVLVAYAADTIILFSFFLLANLEEDHSFDLII